MRYTDRTDAATVSLTALQAQIMADMDGGAGVAWWSGLDEPRRLLAGDYLVGLSASAGANLAQAAMHAARYVELQSVVDFQMRRNLRAAAMRGQVFGPRSEAYDNNHLEADGHFTGFFRAVGSVLDNLGGVVVGASGMPTNLVKASWNDLARWFELTEKIRTKHGHMPEHLGLITDLLNRIDAHVDAGEPDWLDWAMDYRNALVHRASRLGMNVVDDRSRTGVAHPLPRHPAQTQAESMAMSSSITQDMIKREAADTLDSILNNLTALVQFVGTESVGTWNSRREDRRLHLQPTVQWPQLRQGRRLGFDGVGHETRLASNTMLAMHPTTSRRLKFTRLLAKTVLNGGSGSARMARRRSDASGVARTELNSQPRLPCSSRIVGNGWRLARCREQRHSGDRRAVPDGDLGLCPPRYEHLAKELSACGRSSL